MARLIRIDTEVGAVRLEPTPGGGGEVFYVLRGVWGEDRIGTLTVDHRGTSRETWTWWNGVRGDDNGIGAASTDVDAVTALLRLVNGDEALMEAWELGMGEAGWTDEVVERVEKLLPILVESGYAAADESTWRFTPAGSTRAEDLEAR